MMNSRLQLGLQQAMQALQSGDFHNAELLLIDCASIDANNVETIHLLGIVYASQNNHQAAIEYYKKALKLTPEDPSVLSNFGSSLNSTGNHHEALCAFQEAIRIDPHSSEYWYNAGNTLCDMNQHNQALLHYQRSIELNPEFYQSHNNLGKALFELRRYQESLACYEEALSLNIYFLDAFINKGMTLHELKRFDDALAHYDKALSLKPDYAEAWSNKGITLHELKRFDDALAHYDKALSLKPDYAEAWSNKGITLHELKRFDDALAHYDKALGIRPDFHDAIFNKSLAMLLQGDYERGFVLYESRWNSEKVSQSSGKRFFERPSWLGKQSLQGKTILLYGEQGFGDFIQFCRYTKSVFDLGAKVILEVPQQLAMVMQSLEGVSQLVIRGDKLPPFDYQCPLLSLPLALNQNLSNIAVCNSYLTPNQDKEREWHLKLGKKEKQRIGLVWSSMSNFKDDSKRSLILEDLVKALPPDKFEYFCLQRELKQCDKEFLNAYKNIRFFGDELEDFGDTAALISCLDLVISTCTSVPHLSAALGKETWMLLSYTPDWRWLLDRSDSPWYSSLKLYRQQVIGDWTDVLNRVRCDLVDR